MANKGSLQTLMDIAVGAMEENCRQDSIKREATFNLRQKIAGKKMMDPGDFMLLVEISISGACIQLNQSILSPGIRRSVLNSMVSRADSEMADAMRRELKNEEYKKRLFNRALAEYLKKR